MDTKMKYVRLNQFDEIIIFPETLNHSDFKNFGVKSAGFAYVHSDKVVCFGESISLNLKSDSSDSFAATKQLMGYEKANKLL